MNDVIITGNCKDGEFRLIIEKGLEKSSNKHIRPIRIDLMIASFLHQVSLQTSYPINKMAH